MISVTVAWPRQLYAPTPYYIISFTSLEVQEWLEGTKQLLGMVIGENGLVAVTEVRASTFYGDSNVSGLNDAGESSVGSLNDEGVTGESIYSSQVPCSVVCCQE